jgi:mRNA deadenylase 3'-5' endonuclease subunit Ccr4
MRSAYKVFTGKEPEYTSYICNCKNGSIQSEILDYIFISEHWRVLEIKSPQETLATLKYFGVLSFPTANEPSDHILIAATLQLARGVHGL